MSDNLIADIADALRNVIESKDGCVFSDNGLLYDIVIDEDCVRLLLAGLSGDGLESHGNAQVHITWNPDWTPEHKDN